MNYFLERQRLARVRMCLIFLMLAPAMAQASAPAVAPMNAANTQPVAFAVPNAQVQALGISTAPLQSSDSVRASLPGQVVFPPDGEQVLSAPLSGLILQLLVQQNQTVQVGTPMLRIASPELGNLQLQLLQASSRKNLLQQSAERERQLLAEGIIPRRRLQEAQALLSESVATLAQAKAALRLSGMSSTSINQILSSGTVQESLTLVADRAGVITEVAVKLGARVDAATELMRIAQTDRLWLKITVPAAQSGIWQPGVVVQVQGRNSNSPAITGRILSSGTTVTEGSQTIELNAELDSLPTGKKGGASPIRPGEYVNVYLPTSAGATGWDVPLTSVAYDGDLAVVFIRTTAGFEARPVTVLTSAGQQLRVLGALANGEQVAISGVVALKGAWLNAKEAN